ncbi:hypothetical protein DFH07DRAFT_772058 [Mycena maculata]|uniref:Alpha-type protein kinase domain-containing protein n=1 Tax=Mycena maculata TaxID=230809 RepID=A0AAD7JAM7_9AGAR|nr:hypothetical protein DFH07DRAFT_772058 [Mycena maculata]
MDPKVHSALGGYRMPWDRIILREISTWVDLAQQPPNDPYFYERCLTGKPKGKDGAKTFKKPTKPFELALVIDADHWDEILEHLADSEKEIQVSTEKKSRSAGKSKRSSSSTSRNHVESEDSYSDPDSRSGSPSNAVHGLNSARFESVRNDGDHTEPSQSIPKTPPQSKRRAVYESPNRDHLRNALLEGGSSFSQVSNQAVRTTFERIEFFQISERPLNELLSSGKFQGFACDPAHAAPGSVGMENRFLGIGTFKTAHPAYLTLAHLASEGLVAIKRMYVRRAKPTEANPNGWAIICLMPADEYRKIIMEANVLLWATSILTFTYSFIFHFIDKSPYPPPFEIPDIRFVHAGVALVHEAGTGPNSSKFSICRSYLVEELINEEDDGFYKYITNGSAVPFPLPPTANKSLSDLTEFLAFTQHVQLHKTDGMVYLSDLQGSTKLLTDPQIMTAPSIGDGAEIFGDGNVPGAFNAFSDQHICNAFCRWFKLPVLEPVASPGPVTAAE